MTEISPEVLTDSDWYWHTVQGVHVLSGKLSWSVLASVCNWRIHIHTPDNNVVTNRQKLDSIRFGFVSYFSSRSSFRFEFGIILIWKKKSRNLPLQCMCALLFLIPFLFNKRGAGPQGAGMRDSWFVICFRVLHACFSSWFVICFRVLHACFSSWFVICFRVLHACFSLFHFLFNSASEVQMPDMRDSVFVRLNRLLVNCFLFALFCFTFALFTFQFWISLLSMVMHGVATLLHYCSVFVFVFMLCFVMGILSTFLFVIAPGNSA